MLRDQSRLTTTCRHRNFAS